MPERNRYRATSDAAWGTWDKPVRVRLDNRLETVTSPNAALTIMSSRWPTQADSSYREARRQCSNFLKRKASAQQVRNAFTNAARQAGIMH